MAMGSTPLVRAVSAAGVLAWAGAVVWAGLRLDPWLLGGPFQFFGLAVPAWTPFALAFAGVALAACAAALDGWAWPYAPALVALLLGAGSRLLASDRVLLDLAVFAGLVLLSIELLGAKTRFDAVVASSRTLGADERVPVARFLARYLGALLLLVAFYGALLWLLARKVAPALAGLFSARLADGVELDSSVGLVLFGGLLLGLLTLLRLTADGLRRPPPAATAATDIQDLKPVQREATE
jgi:hypothetical protein